MLPHSVKMLSHRVHILAHCGPMVAHRVKVLARDLGEPLNGHRKTRSADQRALIGDRSSDTETRRSLIANRTVVLRPTCSFLSFSYLCRSSRYTGADIGQEEIPVRLARRADRGHRLASCQRRPRG